MILNIQGSAILILNFKIKSPYHEVKVNLKKRKMKQDKSYQKGLKIKKNLFTK